MPKRIDRRVQEIIVRIKAKKAARKYNSPARGLKKNLADKNRPLILKWEAELKS
ncbi:MAG: hypothetical protein LC115_03955 [Bacteroidia bacterium]|nr:hypothetical protein [Bacteroidia bacterium]